MEKVLIQRLTFIIFGVVFVNLVHSATLRPRGVTGLPVLISDQDLRELQAIASRPAPAVNEATRGRIGSLNARSSEVSPGSDDKIPGIHGDEYGPIIAFGDIPEETPGPPIWPTTQQDDTTTTEKATTTTELQTTTTQEATTTVTTTTEQPTTSTQEQTTKQPTTTEQTTTTDQPTTTTQIPTTSTEQEITTTTEEPTTTEQQTTTLAPTTTTQQQITTKAPVTTTIKPTTTTEQATTSTEQMTTTTEPPVITTKQTTTTEQITSATTTTVKPTTTTRQTFTIFPPWGDSSESDDSDDWWDQWWGFDDDMDFDDDDWYMGGFGGDDDDFGMFSFRAKPADGASAVRKPGTKIGASNTRALKLAQMIDEKLENMHQNARQWLQMFSDTKLQTSRKTVRQLSQINRFIDNAYEKIVKKFLESK